MRKSEENVQGLEYNTTKDYRFYLCVGRTGPSELFVSLRIESNHRFHEFNEFLMKWRFLL